MCVDMGLIYLRPHRENFSGNNSFFEVVTRLPVDAGPVEVGVPGQGVIATCSGLDRTGATGAWYL